MKGRWTSSTVVSQPDVSADDRVDEWSQSRTTGEERLGLTAISVQAGEGFDAEIERDERIGEFFGWDDLSEHGALEHALDDFLGEGEPGVHELDHPLTHLGR